MNAIEFSTDKCRDISVYVDGCEINIKSVDSECVEKCVNDYLIEGDNNKTLKKYFYDFLCGFDLTDVLLGLSLLIIDIIVISGIFK